MQYRDQLVPDGSINDVGAYIRTNVPNSDRAPDWKSRFLQDIGPRLRLTGNMALSRNKIRAFTEFRDNWDTGLQNRSPIKHKPGLFPWYCSQSGSDVYRTEGQCIAARLIRKPERQTGGQTVS